MLVYDFMSKKKKKNHCRRNSKKVDENGQRPIPFLTVAAAFIYFRTNSEIVNFMSSYCSKVLVVLITLFRLFCRGEVCGRESLTYTKRG